MSTPAGNEQHDSTAPASRADPPQPQQQQEADEQIEVKKPTAQEDDAAISADTAQSQDSAAAAEQDLARQKADAVDKEQAPADTAAVQKADFSGALARAKAVAALMTAHNVDDTARGGESPQGTKRAYDDIENGAGTAAAGSKRESGNKEREPKRSAHDDRTETTPKKAAQSAKHTKHHEHHQQQQHQHQQHHQQQKNTGGSHHKTGGNINAAMHSIKAMPHVAAAATMASNTTTTKEFQVPHSMAGLVIGRGGENLRRIEQQTLTRVQFTQDPPDAQGMRRVTAVGSPEGVDRAYQLVQALLEDPHSSQAASNTLVLTGQTSELIMVPNERVGLLIGRGGETIREIQRRSNVRINVTPDAQTATGQSERPVQIIGDPQGVHTARMLIQEVIEGTSALVASNAVAPMAQPMPSVVVPGPGGTVTETIEVTHDSIGGIIGRGKYRRRWRGWPCSWRDAGGETVKYLQQLSGARIQVEPNSSGNNPMRKVHISGTQDAVARARSMIDEQVAARNVGSYVRCMRGRGVPGRYDPRAQ
ncbi:hypothetical protein SYNPS1DRAFT_26802 [Syncephalis pseudoplumigaleata]|uniref:K Homology domain-containing protein n=1 Tax=Syncephalis pseudoplumigaleata TaxID=1712513 RepID=A0A4P9Z771_9FUNG|nr:hypothetical protein SYNPS1DRAFT_26802 [Syncephalis pseudoplumigaleata]|eukprot:RKP27540.1 hypothetical protein SYNPS1DRAFT_26802 [Syncephalis pseudoplumigaleata]